MTAKIPLVIAYGVQATDRVRALIDGTVQIEGCEAQFVSLKPGEMLVRSFEDPAFNVAELSLSNYITRRLRGDCPYIALPVPIARNFRHGDIYVRTDRGIDTPQDLRGKRIGITEYEHTAHVWVRGILQSEYGVSPDELIWVSGRLDATSHPVHGNSVFPATSRVERAGEGVTLSQMLEDGRLDGIVSPQAPSVFSNKPELVTRLFRDREAVENDYFRRTGILPILHIMGIRPELAAEYPWLPRRLYEAFVAAKNVAIAGASGAEAQRMRGLMGSDWYPYGLDDGTRQTLASFFQYHFDQGLSDRKPTLDELFVSV